MSGEHQPVLSAEVITGLAIIPDGFYIDATFGRGGHSRLILQSLGPKGRLLAIDQDPAAISAAQAPPFASDQRFTIRQGSFSKLTDFVREQGWQGQVNGVLLDLGVSSPQLDDPQRGFSFRLAGPLDMRMNPQAGLSAANWLNKAQEADIAQVLREYGEERFAKRIAAAIVMARREKLLATTEELAAIVSKAVPFHEPGKHPATRSFQAIRIFVNQELTALQNCLEQCLPVLKIGGRLVVISFHSLEDRIVKEFMQSRARGDVLDKLPLRESQIVRSLRLVSRLIRPTAEEVDSNPRARSARLRIAEKLS